MSIENLLQPVDGDVEKFLMVNRGRALFAEPKYDGHRVLLHVGKNGVRGWSRAGNEVGFTITGLPEQALEIQRRWEQGAPTNTERILAAEAVHDEGIKTYASIEPWIPKLTHPLEIVQRLDGIFDRWIIGAMNYMHQDHRRYLPELKETVAWLDAHQKPYYLKRELQKLLDIDMDARDQTPSKVKARTGGANMSFAARRAWIKIWENRGRQDKADALRKELGIAPGEYR